LSLFSEFIAERMGLDFPESRWQDLRRGLTATATELGFDSAADCVAGLMSKSPTRNQLEILAGNLTVGETYFFRENGSFDVLAERILPALISQRQSGERRLRIWSAACCTGKSLIQSRFSSIAPFLIWQTGTSRCWPPISTPDFYKRRPPGFRAMVISRDGSLGQRALFCPCFDDGTI